MGARTWSPDGAVPNQPQAIHTTLPPNVTGDHLAFAVAQQGGTITAKTPTMITGTFTTHRSPNVLVAILLFVLCIIPAIIYLITESKDRTEPFTVTITPAGQGSDIHVAGAGSAAHAARTAAMRLPH